jgi:hypothetical protein
LGLVYQRRGGCPKSGSGGYASRFWPSHLLMRLAAEHGVDRNTARSDFRRRAHPGSGKRPPKVRDPLRLKALPLHPRAKASAASRSTPRDELAAMLRSQVVALNDFAAGVAVEGCPQRPRWFRQFFGSFRLYGRLHAVGDGNYQSMCTADRLDRIRIAGEPVVEIDIRASLLSFLHGLLRLPLPEGDLRAGGDGRGARALSLPR